MPLIIDDSDEYEILVCDCGAENAPDAECCEECGEPFDDEDGDEE